MGGLKKNILFSIKQSVNAIEQLTEPKNLLVIERATALMADVYRRGGKVLIAGNGGSLCDAMHFAEELTGFFRKARRALPAIALADSAHLTCVGNDAGFDQVFARGVEALGKRQDLFIALSTSGNSTNLLLAVKKAKEIGMHTLALLGKGGGALRGLCTMELLIEGFTTSDRIQEAHMSALHIMIEGVEELLFWGADKGEAKEGVVEPVEPAALFSTI